MRYRISTAPIVCRSWSFPTDGAKTVYPILFKAGVIRTEESPVFAPSLRLRAELRRLRALFVRTLVGYPRSLKAKLIARACSYLVVSLSHARPVPNRGTHFDLQVGSVHVLIAGRKPGCIIAYPGLDLHWGLFLPRRLTIRPV